LRPTSVRDVYYVHTKVVDQLSPRRVPYFEPIFKDTMKQIGDQCSEICLPCDIADIFDTILDFLYCTNRAEEEDYLFNVKNGLALYKIAEYFRIVPLQTMLVTFYRETTMPFNVMEFVHGASKFNDLEMYDSGIEQFALTMHLMEYIEEDKLEPAFLLLALKKRHRHNPRPSQSDSQNISCLVALCTKHYQTTMTRSMFYKLTQEAYIPHIDQEAALQLLTVETQLGYWEDSENFSTVQARCIRSLLFDWNGLRLKFGSDGAFWKTLRDLSPNVLGILLMQSTGTTKGHNDASTSELKMRAVTVATSERSSKRDPPGTLQALVNYR
jgi:hypothetical protein